MGLTGVVRWKISYGASPEPGFNSQQLHQILGEREKGIILPPANQHP